MGLVSRWPFIFVLSGFLLVACGQSEAMLTFIPTSTPTAAAVPTTSLTPTRNADPTPTTTPIPSLTPSPSDSAGSDQPAPSDTEFPDLVELNPNEAEPGVAITLVTKGLPKDAPVTTPVVVFQTLDRKLTYKADLLNVSSDGLRVRVPIEIRDSRTYEQWNVFFITEEDWENQDFPEKPEALPFTRLAIFIDAIEYMADLKVGQSTDFVIHYDFHGTVAFPLRVDTNARQLMVFETEPANRELVLPQIISCNRAGTVISLFLILVEQARPGLVSKPFKVTVTCIPK